jgi:hypothetical protein
MDFVPQNAAEVFSLIQIHNNVITVALDAWHAKIFLHVHNV